MCVCLCVDWVVIPSITLNNITSFNNLLWYLYFEVQPLSYTFYMFLTSMPIFMSIRCNLPSDP